MSSSCLVLFYHSNQSRNIDDKNVSNRGRDEIKYHVEQQNPIFRTTEKTSSVVGRGVLTAYYLDKYKMSEVLRRF